MLIPFLGFCIGIILGLTGAGGEIFAIPALMVGFQWTVQQAVPVALIAIIAVRLSGTKNIIDWASNCTSFTHASFSYALISK